MKAPLGLILPLLACACSKEPADEPRVELTDVGFALHLPPPMQQALDAFAPGFRAIRASSFRSDIAQAAASTGATSISALSSAIGDFDHDGTIDAVVEGTVTGDAGLRVIAVLNGPKPTVLDVTRFAVFDGDAVGVYLTTPPKGTAGAFEVVAYPDSTLLFQFKDGGFAGTTIR